MFTVTPEIIAREVSYNLTKHAPADADTISVIANQLNTLATEYEVLTVAAATWLEANAPEAMTIFAKYEVQSAVELANAMIENSAYSTATKTGGFEKYPLSTWRVWIGKNKRAIAELKAAFDYAKVDMISQAVNVNWWVQ